MTHAHSLIRLLSFVLTLLGGGILSPAQTVVHVHGTGKPLAERWSGAIEEAKGKGFEKEYWIGYSIERMMNEHSYIGSFFSDPRRNKPTLEELLTGMTPEDRISDHSVHGISSMDGMISFDDEQEPRRKVVKEVGILFHMPGTRDRSVDELKVSNLSLHVDLGVEPIFWLGVADYAESVTFLESVFSNINVIEIKKRLIMAIGLHNDSKDAISFLKRTLQGSGISEVREEAAFWLGQTNSEDARKILTETAWDDKSEDVREKAVFAISQMEGEASTDALISLAKTHRDMETRKKATFWLGQKASEKAVGTLKELVYKDEETEVQKSALFALTQQDDGEAVSDLVTIARTHPNPEIRKQAIFWLGQCEDPKALDALIKIIRN
ncbi:MAG TPA: HEAT repeat domain-containing protein [Bacteroidota bacterium]|jgi:hypothetical protein|nr:HEAT repeat domain-containing protein [Bacteroidota bacterium]